MNTQREYQIEVRELPCPRWGERRLSARIAGGAWGYGSSPWNAIADAIHADNSDICGRLCWD